MLKKIFPNKYKTLNKELTAQIEKLEFQIEKQNNDNLQLSEELRYQTQRNKELLSEILIYVKEKAELFKLNEIILFEFEKNGKQNEELFNNLNEQIALNKELSLKLESLDK